MVNLLQEVNSLMKDVIHRLHDNGKTVAFTNGCFDGLHEGHRLSIKEAKAQADILVVAVNNDASVRRLKGLGRPKHKLIDRVIALMELDEVDCLMTFGDLTPIKLIESICPDVLVKGGDYTRDQVIGAELVESYGGRVHLTDSLIKKVLV